MARPTQQEIEEWEARMSEPEDTDSDDFEVVLFDEQGNPVGTMPFNKAKAYFAKRGISFDDDAPAGDAAGIPPNGGKSANRATGNPAQGSQLPPSAPRTRTSSRYFGKNPGIQQPSDGDLPPAV